MDKNLYTILKLPSYSSIENIKSNYKHLIKIHHPDKGGDNETFQSIQNAYTILCDIKSKQKYDDSLLYPPLNLHSILSPSASPKCQTIPIYTDIYTIMDGNMNSYEYSLYQNCTSCNSTGIHNHMYNTIICNFCNGLTTVSSIENIACPYCKGKGFDILHHVSCKACKGNTKLAEKKYGSVYIPPGLPDNHLLSINSSLILKVIHKHNIECLKIQDHDLIITLDITLKDVICGFYKHIQIAGKNLHFSSNSYFDFSKNKVFQNEGIQNIGNLTVCFNLVYENHSFYKKLSKALENISPKIKPTNKKNVFIIS